MKKDFKIKRRQLEPPKSELKFEKPKPVKKAKKPQPQKAAKVKNTAPKAPREQRGFKVIEGGKSPRRVALRFTIFGVVAALVAALVITNFLLPTGLVEFVKVNMALNVGGDGYPVSFLSGISKSFVGSGNGLVVLTDSDLKCYNSAGAEVYTRLHGYANPVVRSSQMRTLTFDRDGTQYRIDSADQLIHSAKSEKKIITADICRSGAFVLVTESDDDVAEVTVYSAAGREQYKYYSSQSYVICAALSENGKYLCVVSANADNATLSSKLSIFSISHTDPVFTGEFENELISIADGSTSNSFVAISDKSCRKINSSGELTEYPFNNRVLVKYELLGENTLLCLASDANSADSSIVIVNKACGVRCDFSVNATVSSVSASDRQIYILSNGLQCFDYEGTLLSSAEVDAGAVAVKPFDGKAAVLYAQAIMLY